MKKNFKYAILSAIALVGAVNLTSCSSSDDVVDNPNYLPEENAVKTQFNISFPENVAGTRQTAGTVQQGESLGDFLGMDNIVLYPFAETAPASTTTTAQNPVTSTSLKLGERIELTSMIKPTVSTVTNSIPAAGLNSGSNSVLFNDVTIPIGTGSFLFYGKAIKNSTYLDKFYNGSLNLINISETNPQAALNPANINFELEQIYPSTTTASPVGAALAIYLSNIAQAAGWSDCASTTGLGDLYAKFITLKAGSSLTVQAAIQDLYTSVRNNTDAVSAAIKSAILDNNYVEDTNNPAALTFKAAIGNSASTYFPGDVNLPDGAALLSYNSSTKVFSQKTDGSTIFGTVGETTTSKITSAYADYVYPASLYYYGNSGIGVATSSQASAYNTTNSWATILGGYTADKQVQSSTRSVAILDPIQYGVGRMDMTINALAATLYDKKGEAYTPDDAGFTVTGVLIGGQKRVNYDFTTNTSATERAIYDNITKSQAPSTVSVTTSSNSATNYTLALQTAPETPIYVAIELLNNGADFEGVDGVIPAGCKFYLVGKLDPTADGTYDTSNTAANVSYTGKRVFMQDFKTIVTFTIVAGEEGTTNNKGLGAAYNTIPDLRTPELELGLSVNLEWQPGIIFNVNL